MVTKVIVYSFLYGVVYCTTARENINETRVKIKLDRGGRIHKGSFIFFYLCVTFICVEITASSTTEFDIRVISFMNVLASHETAGFVVSVSLFAVFIEFPSSKDGILPFHSSFRCRIIQMTSLEQEKISTRQYNQIPLTLDSQNKDFFCPIILWKTKQLEREIVLRLCVRYRASLIFFYLANNKLHCFWKPRNITLYKAFKTGP